MSVWTLTLGKINRSHKSHLSESKASRQIGEINRKMTLYQLKITPNCSKRRKNKTQRTKKVSRLEDNESITKINQKHPFKMEALQHILEICLETHTHTQQAKLLFKI